jgi:hypothetical protein
VTRNNTTRITHLINKLHWVDLNETCFDLYEFKCKNKILILILIYFKNNFHIKMNLLFKVFFFLVVKKNNLIQIMQVTHELSKLTQN